MKKPSDYKLRTRQLLNEAQLLLDAMHGVDIAAGVDATDFVDRVRSLGRRSSNFAGLVRGLTNRVTVDQKPKPRPRSRRR